jgi:Terminase large subunit, T4likevirus-type, N-terminal
MILTKREILKEKWLRGRLTYKLHAGQKILRERFRSSHSQLFVGECARQFGKSFEMVVEALELAFSKPKARIKYGTAYHTDLIEFIIPTFDAVLSDCPEEIRPRYKVQGSKFVLPHNKSEIKLVGLDRNPNGLRGNVIDLIILDEAGFIMNLDYLYKSVIIPATTHRPDCKIVFISTPPSTPAHPFLDYVEKAEYEGSYCKLTIYDNPMVDDKTIERLKVESGGEKSTTWRREYLCEHVVDSNLAIVNEWKDEYVTEINRDEYYPFYHKYVSMDLGVKDNTAIIFGYYDFLKATLVLEEEYVMNGPELTTEVLRKAIREKEEALGWNDKPYLRVSDNNNPLLLQDLSYLHQIHFLPTDKGSLEEMINTLRLMIDQGRIKVHPRCKQLRGCLKYGVWDKNRQKFAQSKVYGHFDALAALVYLVRNLNKSTNPIPPSFKLDQDNAILFPHQRESQNVRDLKKAFSL